MPSADELLRLRDAAENVLSRLMESFPDATFVGRDYTVQDIRSELTTALAALREKEGK